MAPRLTHLGIFVRDLARMERFYVDVIGLTVTDRGRGIKFPVDYVFLSADPGTHHQLVLCTGRPEGAASTVFQLSFTVASLDELRRFHRTVTELGLGRIRPINHGNALSLYFEDPEGNTVELYLDTPHHVAQPHYHPLDLALSDADIAADTAAHVAADPSYLPRALWRERMALRMGEA